MSIKTFIGIDPSINGTGFFRMDVDKLGNVIQTENFAFAKLTAKKNRFESSSNIIAYHKEDFGGDRFKQYEWTVSKILKCIPKFNPVYIGIEGYAMQAGGMAFDIGEFVGILTYQIRTNFKNVFMKEYPPMTVKMLMSGRGDADKGIMCKRFNDDASAYKPDLTHLDDNKSPRADIVDAWHIAHLAMNDLMRTNKFDSFLTKKPRPKSLDILESEWIIPLV